MRSPTVRCCWSAFYAILRLNSEQKITMKWETLRRVWEIVSLTWEQEAVVNLAPPWCISLANWTHQSSIHNSSPVSSRSLWREPKQIAVHPSRLAQISVSHSIALRWWPSTGMHDAHLRSVLALLRMSEMHQRRERFTKTACSQIKLSFFHIHFVVYHFNVFFKIESWNGIVLAAFNQFKAET